MEYSHFDFKYIDIHTHFFPPKIFRAIWKFFERKDVNGKIIGWKINYKLPIEDLVKFLKEHNVEHYTTLNYAHKEGVAEYINNWTIEFVKNYPEAIPFGCIWHGDKNKDEYIRKLFDEHNFTGIKIQTLVQNFYPGDKRMDSIYKLIIDRSKWLLIHAGMAPYRNRYVGFKNFKKFIEKFPNMQIIVAHFGAFEYKKFIKLLDIYDNLYLDTAMIFVSNNIIRERIVKRPTAEELISIQDRILFGSDFPNIPYDYKNSIEGLLKLGLPYEFYKKIFYENAYKLFIK
ncbi:MAG: amidohydrolase family protein [Promethearchaeia archaeon]